MNTHGIGRYSVWSWMTTEICAEDCLRRHLYVISRHHVNWLVINLHLRSPVFRVLPLSPDEGVWPFPGNSKLSITALRDKNHQIALDEYWRLVTCYFANRSKLNIWQVIPISGRGLVRSFFSFFLILRKLLRTGARILFFFFLLPLPLIWVYSLKTWSSKLQEVRFQGM